MHNLVQTSAPVPTTPVLEQPEFQTWRNRMLTGILHTVSFFGIIVLISNSINIVQNADVRGEGHDLPLLIVSVVVYLGLLLVTLLRRLNYTIRVCMLLALIYTVGMVDFYQYGLRSTGTLFFFLFVILTMLFFNQTWGILALGVALISMASYAPVFVSGYHQIPVEIQASSTKLNEWLLTMFVYLLIVSVIVLTI